MILPSYIPIGILTQIAIDYAIRPPYFFLRSCVLPPGGVQLSLVGFADAYLPQGLLSLDYDLCIAYVLPFSKFDI